MRRRGARGKVSPTVEQLMEDFIGLSSAASRPRRQNPRPTTSGINFLALTPEDLVGFIAACDRKLQELKREEAETFPAIL